ncbi:hypothetical protein RCL1_001247 [Eukaryota sp. TZLM3-RCL]
MEDYRRRAHEEYLRRTGRASVRQPSRTSSIQTQPNSDQRARQIAEDEELARRLQAEFLLDAEAMQPSSEAEILSDSEESPVETFSSTNPSFLFESFSSAAPTQQRRGPHPGRLGSMFSMLDQIFHSQFDRMRSEPSAPLAPEMFMLGGLPLMRTLDPSSAGGIYEYLSRLETVPTPTNTEVARQLPEVSYRPDPTQSEPAKCSICLGEFEEGEKLIVLPCFHQFHKECAEELFKRSHICPVCRFDINSSQ